MDKRRIQTGSGVYTCQRCDQKTRDTGTGEAQFELCAACFEIEGYENQHSDDDHAGSLKDCEECRAQMSSKAKEKLDVES